MLLGFALGHAKNNYCHHFSLFINTSVLLKMIPLLSLGLDVPGVG